MLATSLYRKDEGHNQPNDVEVLVVYSYNYIIVCSSDDFSDYNEEDEDDVGETIIVTGVQGECKDNGEGKYRYGCMCMCVYYTIILHNTSTLSCLPACTTYQMEG